MIGSYARPNDSKFAVTKKMKSLYDTITNNI